MFGRRAAGGRYVALNCHAGLAAGGPRVAAFHVKP